MAEDGGRRKADRGRDSPPGSECYLMIRWMALNSGAAAVRTHSRQAISTLDSQRSAVDSIMEHAIRSLSANAEPPALPG